MQGARRAMLPRSLSSRAPFCGRSRPFWVRGAIGSAADARNFHATPRLLQAERLPVTLFTEEEDALRDTVAQFSRDRIQPKVKSMDEKGELDPDLLQECFQQGLMAIEAPHELGGGGMSFTAACVAIEELAKVDPAVSVVVDVQNTLVGTAIRKWGSQQQQQEWMPRLATDTLGSFCLSEWSCGSDAFALKTTAAKDGGDFVLNGTKAWITNAKEAGVYVVFANADPNKGHKGITAFIVDRKNPGLKVGKKEDKLGHFGVFQLCLSYRLRPCFDFVAAIVNALVTGIRASSTCEVILEDCRVPASAILGEFGKGYKIAIESLNEGRIGIGAQMLGLAEGVFDHTMRYINQRQAFKQPIAEFQGVQFQYAKAYCDILGAKIHVYNAARLKEAGKPFVLEASVAKLEASEVAERVSSICVNLMGGIGFTKEVEVEKYFRDCKIGQIYEGTSNIQLQTIAKIIQQQYK